MFLKSLEIWGFKSFCDKTVLTFDEGMTAVVGPNGSGKSNILDAILWVFGEQSIKNLRGSSMEDVIFSGSKIKKPSNVAKVSLFLNNKNRKLSIDSDDVVIERKLYRSGDSYYKINGKDVRLKDVYELFMDTGLGKNGYSIVSQGKISEFVSLKPEDRTYIFEEASGISKYKYKKKEAQKNLLKTKENLNRINDIKSEVKNQFVFLEKESKKAEEFLVLFEKKKKSQISIYVYELEKINEVLRKNSNKLYYMNEELEDFQKNIDILEKLLEDKFLQSNKISSQIDLINQENTKIVEDNANINSKIAVLKNDIFRNNELIEKINFQIEKFDKDKNVYLKEKENLLKKFQTTKEEIKLKTDEIEKLNLDLIELELEFSDDEKQNIDDLVLKSLNLNSNISTIENTILSNEENIEIIKIEEKKLFDKLSEVNEEIDKINERINNKNSDIEININKKNGFLLKYNNLKNQLEELNNKKLDFESKIFSLRQKINANKDLLENMDGFFNSVVSVIKQAKLGRLHGIISTVSDVVKTKDEYRDAIEVSLSSYMQNIITKTSIDAKNAIEFLKQKNLGRATFLPIDNIKSKNYKNDTEVLSLDGVIGFAFDLIEVDDQYENIFKSLIGNVLIVEDITTATNVAKKIKFSLKIVTLDGQVINPGGSMTGGSKLKKQSFLSRKSDIDNFENQLNTYIKELSEIKTKLTKSTEDFNFINKNVKDCDYTINELNFSVLSLQNDLEISKSKKNEIENKFNEIKSNVTKLFQDNESLTKTLNDKKNDFNNINNKINLLKDKFEKNIEKNKNVEIKKQNIKNKINEYSFLILSKNKDLEFYNSTINTLDDNKDNILKNLKSFELELKTLKENNIKLEKEIYSIQNFSKTLLANKLTNEKKLKDLNNEKLLIEKLTVDKRREIKDILGKKESVFIEYSKLDEKNNTIKLSYDEIISKLFNDYEMTKSEADEYSFEIKDINYEKSILQNLNNKIKSLGNINVSSIDEFNIVKERYEFLNTQVEDIEKSKSHIEKTIDDITVKMKTKFIETFNLINENFKKTFYELFGDGYAELVLTNPDDVLNTGIDINIHLTLKKVKNISLLSGGEKSFVSIAVYFAIFHVNPASFCILDEIEAALDDVNVIKFAKYVKSLCNKTQFITITHRRGTMEEADVLYGITMQKDGFSRTLKLDSTNIDKTYIK